MFEIVIRPTGDLVDFLAWDEFSEVMSRVTETGKAKVVRPVAKGRILAYSDVELDTATLAYKIRKEMEKRARQGDFMLPGQF